MNFKFTAGLLVALLCLLSWVYFTDIRGREERTQKAEDAKKVVPIDAEAITEISIIYPGTLITAVRADEKWVITEPRGIEADSAEWDLLVSNVPRIERDQTLETKPMDLGRYGLAEPGLRLLIKMTENRLYEVMFGNENPRKLYNYAKLASVEEVFLVPSSWLRIFRKEINDLRDKVVLSFEQNDIDEIEILGQTNVRLIRAGEEWSLIEPIEKKADQREVGDFLGFLKFVRAADFVDNEEDLKAANLDDPVVTIVLHEGREDKTHRLVIGAEKKDESGHFFVKQDSKNTVFVVDNELVEKADRPIFFWRDKTILSFDRQKVLSIKVTKPGEQLLLRKSGEDWVLSNGERAKFGSVSSMLNGVEFEKATRIIDSPGSLTSYGLTNPRLRVALLGDSEEVAGFSFGQDSPDGVGVYWKRDQERTVRVVPKAIFERFNLTRENLKESQ